MTCKEHRDTADIECDACVEWLISNETEMRSIEIMCVRERVAAYAVFRIKNPSRKRVAGVFEQIFDLTEKFQRHKRLLDTGDHELMRAEARKLIGIGDTDAQES